jgi:hypothetical protein
MKKTLKKILITNEKNKPYQYYKNISSKYF